MYCIKKSIFLENCKVNNCFKNAKKLFISSFFRAKQFSTGHCAPHSVHVNSDAIGKESSFVQHAVFNALCDTISQFIVGCHKCFSDDESAMQCATVALEDAGKSERGGSSRWNGREESEHKARHSQRVENKLKMQIVTTQFSVHDRNGTHDENVASGFCKPQYQLYKFKKPRKAEMQSTMETLQFVFVNDCTNCTNLTTSPSPPPLIDNNAYIFESRSQTDPMDMTTPLLAPIG